MKQDRLHPRVNSETDRLRTVVLGHANSMGSQPSLENCYDAKSYESVALNQYPKEEDCRREIEFLADVLKRHKVEVIRPDQIDNLNQIFARDISFVIDQKLIVPNIIEDRAREKEALSPLMSRMEGEDIIELTEKEHIEGGDCLLWKDKILIGYSEDQEFQQFKTARTNRAAVDKIQSLFPKKEVIAVQLNKSDQNPREGVLHLDCCFQPIGKNEAIIYKAGFKKASDVEKLVQLFGEENLISVNKDEFYHMFPNVFSIAEDIVISNTSFERLNQELEKRGYTVEAVPYDNISRMGGLLRCSTMPITRG